MFDNLSKRLTESLDKLRRRGTLNEADVDAALREVRIALLEADVALPVVKEFIAALREKAIGAAIIATINPAQMVIKLVHDALVELLGGRKASETADSLAAQVSPPGAHGVAAAPWRNYEAEINLAATPPAVVLMCGLQGSGKTTTSAKLAKRLQEKQRKRVLLASLDVYRPAAQEQLATVAGQVGAQSLGIIPGQMPRDITARALETARTGGYDVLILDTAGRLHVDAELMDELQAVKTLAKPVETLLVADALTGQDAVNIAKIFHAAIGVTGIILTRLDGDARGGAALSMRHVTGQPIKYMGVGEKLDALEPFHPERIAGRILDRGDVVALVERAAEVLNEKDAEAAARRMMAGAFDMNDMLKHMQQIRKMGGVGSMLGLMPGMGKIKEMMAGREIDESAFGRQEAIILSMTGAERARPQLLNASRRRRIAAGSGTSVQDVNRLVKQYQQMETMMKQMKKMGAKGAMNPAALKRMFGM